jgi:hypothetical protein
MIKSKNSHGNSKNNTKFPLNIMHFLSVCYLAEAIILEY